MARQRRNVGLYAIVLLLPYLMGCGTSEGTAVSSGSERMYVALILPSASDDLAWSHGMLAGIRAAQDELGADAMELAIEEDLPSPGDAAASIGYYAEQGYDLIIAHGPQYREVVLGMAAGFPEVSFAYGPGSELAENVFAYEPQAQEGGYLLGMLAGMMTRTSKIGLVGLVEDESADKYAKGFAQGVHAVDGDAELLVAYTGSYGSIAAAVQIANAHLESGADVLTGSALRDRGAVQAAEEHAVLWLASDMGETTGWPQAVGAAQVYDWQDVVRYLLERRRAGVKGGEDVLLTFGNGRLSLVLADDLSLPEEVRSEVEAAALAISDGSLVVE